MKKIFKRNQVIITSLVIMIIVAGYLNFTADKVSTTTEVGNIRTQSSKGEVLENIAEGDDGLVAVDAVPGADGLVDVDVAPEEDLSMVMGENSAALAEYAQGEELSDEVEHPEDIGEAVLTSTTSAAAVNFGSSAKLSREQTRSKNKETLQAMIDNMNVAENVRQEAADDLMEMTKIAERELAAETMLEAKGYANSVVSINEASVDVVVCLESLTDTQKAQIEDTVMRKAECEAGKIVITTLKSE